MTETEIECPFCGETITLVIDCSEADQNYVEDCSVCCRPINVHVRCTDGEMTAIETTR